MKKATREHTKAHNRNLILNEVYSRGEVSRADLARATSLTRSTVSEIVTALIEDALIVEVGHGVSAGGKPPILLNVDNEARHVIGIDLASGEFRGALINLRGEIRHRVNIPVGRLSGERALFMVYELIDELLKLADRPILGIGIGTPGLMDVKQGVVITAVNLDWQNLPLAELLQDRYNLPVCIANDSQVSALAEYSFGEHDQISNLVLVKVGRGVGSGIVHNKELYYGDGFGAGEIGHVKVDEDGDLCGCGNYGCLETKISSRVIRNRVIQIVKDHKDSKLYSIWESAGEITTADILQACLNREAYVVEIIDDVSKDLAKALSFLVSILNIQRIVIAGSVSEFGDALIMPLREYLQPCALSILTENTEIVTSSLGEKIVMLGAAALILQNELGIK
ncbi:MAG: ROK family transcriptional regulator [Anaerolineales bacterium]|nr:ROK family transcriptional regulator [Anaerolineales bacterium]